jgi:hypothetical protein
MVFDPTREESPREPLAEPEPREEREADREQREKPREEESHPDEEDLEEQAPRGPGP